MRISRTAVRKMRTTEHLYDLLDTLSKMTQLAGLPPRADSPPVCCAATPLNGTVRRLAQSPPRAGGDWEEFLSVPRDTAHESSERPRAAKWSLYARQWPRRSKDSCRWCLMDSR